MVVFAFNNAVSEQAEADILSMMESMKATLVDLEKDIKNLEPAWIATEADFYYKRVRKFRKHADIIISILSIIENQLRNSRLAIQEYREGVGRALRS